jgi:acetyl esterase/lipase
MRARDTFVLLILFLLMPSCLFAEAQTKKDLVYAEVDGQKLALDLYMPEEVKNPPLVVWIHGGGWNSGSKNGCKVTWLTEHGYAVASISYRLSGVAPFPAQLHDCKAAIRWLRANAAKYGYSTEKIVVSGSSAGGMLALLVGTTGSEKELEGEGGGNLEFSSRVDAIIDYYGSSDFVARIKTLKPNGAVSQLFGGPADEKIDLAKTASAVNHVSPDDPPLLIIHGAKDPVVDPQQAVLMEQAYRKMNLPVELVMLPNVKHGGGAFFAQSQKEKVLSFLKTVGEEKPGDAPPKPMTDKE